MRNLLAICSVLLTYLFTAAQAWAVKVMPVQGNSYATEVDSLYKLLLVASLISFILVIGGMVFFVLKYKRKSANDQTPYISHDHKLEFLWSFIPFLIFIFVFAWGWKLFREARTMPKDAFEIHVTGQKWAWNFEYKSGVSVTSSSDNMDAFVVPVNTPIKLIMTSKDVLHSFFLPVFRIKQDVIPGRYTALWFEAEKEGEFQVFCTEYCGDLHSMMLAKVKVVSMSEFEEWMQTHPSRALGQMTLAEKGEYMVNKSACTACHNFNNNVKKIGPGLKGLFGKERQFEDGSTAIADANYIMESIYDPQKKYVKGFAGVNMNKYLKKDLSPEQISWIIEYIKSNK